MRRFKILSCGGVGRINRSIFVVYGGGLVLPLIYLSEVKYGYKRI